MDTLLPRIDKPRNPIMKMVYAMDRRTTGRVTAPISVFAARMPLAFGNFYGKLSRLDKKLKLPHATALIIREQTPPPARHLAAQNVDSVARPTLPE
jgi:hypothetical protein